MAIKILYVDDEPDIREVASLSLQLDPAMEVRQCASGEEAIDVAIEWLPDLILLDVMMPRMDGPATFAKLKEDARTADIGVVFITARTQASDVARFKGLGAKGVIAKPFSPMSLAKEVRAYL